MKKIILDEVKLSQILRSVINQMIAEELSISDKVSDAVSRLERIINDMDISRLKVYDEDGFKFCFIEFNHLFSEFYSEGMEEVPNFKVLLKVYLFSDAADMFMSGFKKEMASASVNLADMVLNVTAFAVGGKIKIKALEEQLYHECEHIFQMAQTDRTGSEEYDKLYDLAISVLSDGKHTEEEEYLARVIYCASNVEQDAFVNELYSRLKNNRGYFKDGFERLLYSSQAYQALYILRDFKYRYNNKNLDTYKYNALLTFKKGCKWFLSLSERAERRLYGKIRKVVAKAYKDKKNGGNIKLPPIENVKKNIV